MKCQLVSTLEAGRRARGSYAYPVIWARAASRYVRWYMTRAGQALGKSPVGGPAKMPPSVKGTGERRLEAGDWVRVKSRAEIEARQQGADIADAVAFIPAPMSRYCGRTLRVLRVLDHYYDEIREGLHQAENAVLLEGATCDSSQLGNRRCGRACLHFWKESWLEHVDGPGQVQAHERFAADATQPRRPSQATPDSEVRNPGLRPGETVRVRDLSSIARTLDKHGVHEGVPFVPEHMAASCGRIFVVASTITHFFDEKADYMIRLPRAYLLAGGRCDGRQADGEVHCGRGCALIWHGAWLERAGPEPACDAGERQEDI